MQQRAWRMSLSLRRISQKGPTRSIDIVGHDGWRITRKISFFFSSRSWKISWAVQNNECRYWVTSSLLKWKKRWNSVNSLSLCLLRKSLVSQTAPKLMASVFRDANGLCGILQGFYYKDLWDSYRSNQEEEEEEKKRTKVTWFSPLRSLLLEDKNRAYWLWLGQYWWCRCSCGTLPEDL